MKQNNIESLINYISQRQENFRESIVGADDEKIEQLNSIIKSVTGLDLPDDYREFLAKIGGAKPPVSFSQDASMMVDDVIDVYQDMIDEDDFDELPSNSFYIAVKGYELYNVALECTTDFDGKSISGRVFDPDGTNISRVFAEDFIHYLYGQAFSYVGAKGLPCVGTLKGEKLSSQLGEIEKVCGKFGLEKLWFSGSTTLCMSDKNEYLTVMATQRYNEYVWLRVAGRVREQANLLADALKNEADLQLERWWS